MIFKKVEGSDGRDTVERTLRQLIEWNRTGRMEHCSLVFTLVDCGKRENFLLYFAPSHWRQTVGNILVAAAAYVLGGRPALLHVTEKFTEEELTPPPQKEHRVH